MIYKVPRGFNNVAKLEEKLKHQSELKWIQRGESRALTLFHLMAERVPAYKDFLAKNKVKHEKIHTFEDFKKVPFIDKINYLRSYPLDALCWDGELKHQQWVVSTTSGSTGEPFYFPREKAQDWQYAISAELYLRANFQIQKKSTLYIVGFPMGAWIGGLFTYQALRYVAEKGNYDLSIITPGINKIEIINTVRKLGHKFDQVIIGSYGPFLKDILDEGIRLGLDWKRYNIGFVFSAEVFNEKFRDFVIRTANIKDKYRGTLNHYGTVDLGTMAHETPLSILARRIMISNPQLYKFVFGNIAKLPTFAQYIPEMFFFEDIKGSLICSAYGGLPLVRYDLKDHGGIITLSDLSKKFKENKIDLFDIASKENITDTIWNIPFVYVYERSDFSVSFFAFQIYPETIRKALQDVSVERYITGKFTMVVKFDEENNQYFEINIELKKSKRPTKILEGRVRHLIIKRLLHENSEYRKTAEEYPTQTIPRIVFWDYENSKYFSPGAKQKWSIKL